MSYKGGAATITQKAEAPFQVLSTTPVIANITGLETSTMTGVKVDLQGDLNHKAGQQITTQPLIMTNTTSARTGKSQTVTTKQHSLAVTVKVGGKINEEAPKLDHKGTSYESELNTFKAELILDTTQVNYLNKIKQQQSRSWYGKKRKKVTHTQSPLSVCQPNYTGITILDAHEYKGCGAVFSALLQKNQKARNLIFDRGFKWHKDQIASQ